MSALTPKAIRQRIATALEAVSGWKENAHLPMLFPVLDSNKHLDHSFSVNIIDTKIYGNVPRQRSGDDCPVESTVEIKFARLVIANGQIASLDSLLEDEQTLIQTVKGISQIDLHILYQSSTRQQAGNGSFVVVTALFRAIHTITL